MTCGYLSRNGFLKCMASIYLMAFISTYTQIPGLYGRNGVLPVHTKVPTSGDVSRSRSPGDVLLEALPRFLERPTLLWFRQVVGLDAQHALEAVALLGAVLALMAMMFEMFRTSLVFASLWLLYTSIVQVGQVFMWFQWDSLLLETGVLCVLLAPLFPWQRSGYHGSWDALGMWLVRWLLFRLMFASGVVKLQSGCPTWWGLSALEVHFESQCIPTPLAWYCHHLPVWFLRLSTALSIYIEVALPFLFFAPIRRLRLFAFAMQVFLQVTIILTGNYNFFNLLTVTLCLSLLDDDFHRGRTPVVGTLRRVLTSLVTYAVYAGITFSAVKMFDIRWNGAALTSRVAFSKSEFDQFAAVAVPASIVLAAATLLITAGEVLINNVFLHRGGCCKKLNSLFHSVLAILVVSVMFGLTLAPYTASLDPVTHKHLPNPLKSVHDSSLRDTSMFNSYGLFRRMTGVGGRPEVVLEGADTMNGPWKEIEFHYKPGDLYVMPRFIFPHQPRLDWQMWFAALGSYHDNPWLTSLAYRILTAQPEVLRLLKWNRNHFAQQAPKYIRAVKYLYHYTNWDEQNKSWWRRDAREDFMPIFSADHKPLLEYLRQMSIIGGDEEKVASGGQLVTQLLDQLRRQLEVWQPELLIWSVLVAVVLVQRTRGVGWLK